MKNRLCPVCESVIQGRPDKKFCSPNCKSAHQYEMRKKEEEFYFQVDAQLKTNRKLLKRFNQKGKTIIRRDEFEKEGFNARFFTHYWKNQQNEVYYFCYEFGFRKIHDKGIKKYLLVSWQPYMN